MDAIWLSLSDIGIPVAEKIIRTVVVYAFLVVGLRFFGKRELGQLNPLDFIVLLLLSNTVQNAIIGSDNSLAGGLLGAGVLFVVNDLIVRYAYKHPRMRRFIEGRPEQLVRDGRVIHAALERNCISMDELVAAARKQGFHDLHAVDSARLEVSGALSFEAAAAGGVTRFQQEVLTRLAAIEKKVAVA